MRDAVQVTRRYPSPLGEILLAAEDVGLTGAWFAGQKFFASTLAPDAVEGDTPVLNAACRWLDAYFSGDVPGFDIPLRLTGTEFRKSVWEALQTIPRGRTVTYGDIARRLNASPRAVGGAVGHNPVSVFVPCHRVVGKNRSLTGYAGGLGRKIALLTLEGANFSV